MVAAPPTTRYRAPCALSARTRSWLPPNVPIAIASESQACPSMHRGQFAHALNQPCAAFADRLLHRVFATTEGASIAMDVKLEPYRDDGVSAVRVRFENGHFA